MSIDLSQPEQLLTPSQAAGHFPVRPSTRTLWRWLTRGVRGVKLESVLVGGRRLTSKPAISRFLHQLNAPDKQSAWGENGQAEPPACGENGQADGQADGQHNKNKKNTKKESARFRSLVRADFPDVLQTQEFLDAWADWEQHRREIKKPLTTTSVKQQLRSLADMGHGRAVAAIRHTIEKGWQGLREPDSPQTNNNAGNGKSTYPTLERVT